MGARGPKPKSKLSVINPTKKKRPNPPFGMVARSRNLFKKIVNDNPVDTFSPELVILLAAFCDMENQRYLSTKKVEAYGVVIQNEVYIPQNLATACDPDAIKQYTYIENPWYKVMKETTASLGALSAKLRAGGVKTTKSEKKEPVSKRDGLMFNG